MPAIMPVFGLFSGGVITGGRSDPSVGASIFGGSLLVVGDEVGSPGVGISAGCIGVGIVGGGGGGGGDIDSSSVIMGGV